MSNSPEIKVVAISNVYCRLMDFKKRGDVELGHCHTYDHGTLVASGSLLVEMLRDDESVISQKVFKGPSFIFVSKLCKHRLTALEDNTIAVCIHALRDVDNNLVDPDFFVDEKWFVNKKDDSDNINDHFDLYTEIKRKVPMKKFTISENERDLNYFLRGGK